MILVTRRSVPLILIVFRLAAGPAVLALGCTFGAGARHACAILLALGVLSDVFDGVIARMTDCATPALRKLDSRADVVFWLCIVADVAVVRPDVRISLLVMAGVLVVLELAPPIVSFVRFRQASSTHHILSKVFGLGLWLLTTVLLLQASAGRLQSSVFVIGVVSQLEALAIMLVIPTWRADVRGLGHALRLRRQAPGAVRARATAQREEAVGLTPARGLDRATLYTPPTAEAHSSWARRPSSPGVRRPRWSRTKRT